MKSLSQLPIWAGLSALIVVGCGPAELGEGESSDVQSLLGCIGDSSGTYTETHINNALNGADAEAVLCAGSVFSITNPVLFDAPRQKIYTQDDPTGSTRAKLVIVGSQATAIDGGQQSDIVIRHIQVEGSR